MTRVTSSSVTDLRLTVDKYCKVLQDVETAQLPLQLPHTLPRTEMPSGKTTEDWVLSLRTYIKTQLDKDAGTNWQIIENKGKARLGIRFDDGTRTYKYLPYK